MTARGAPGRSAPQVKATFTDIARKPASGPRPSSACSTDAEAYGPATVEKVVAAARALDYPRRLPEVHRGLLRIEVILVRPETTFFQRLSRAFERIGATLDPSVKVHRTFVDENDPRAIAARIASTEIRRAGLILAVPDHPEIRDSRHHRRRFGSAGRPRRHPGSRGARAIWSASTTMPPDARRRFPVADAGPAGSRHGARATRSTRSIASACAASPTISPEHPRDGLRLPWIGFGRDDARAQQRPLCSRRWRPGPDLVGLYNAGGANASLCNVLRRHSRGRQVFFVGHELTESSAAALREGVMAVVLDQAPEAQARRAIDLMLKKIGLLDVEVDTAPIRFITLTAENV